MSALFRLGQWLTGQAVIVPVHIEEYVGEHVTVGFGFNRGTGETRVITNMSLEMALDLRRNLRSGDMTGHSHAFVTALDWHLRGQEGLH